MNRKKILKLIGFTAVISLTLQEKTEADNNSLITFTSYRSKNKQWNPLSEAVLLNKEGLKEESKKFVNGKMSYSYNLKHKRIEVSVVYSDLQKSKTAFAPPCPEHRINMSFLFYPNSTYLNKTLLYTLNRAEEDLFKLNVSSDSENQNNEQECIKPIDINAVSLSLESYTKYYKNETLANLTPKLKELRLFQIHAKNNATISQFSLKGLKEIGDPKTEFEIGLKTIILMIISLGIYILIVWIIFGAYLIAFDLCGKPADPDLLKYSFPFFGCSLLQLSNSIALLISAIMLEPMTIVNILALIFIILPTTAFHLVLVFWSVITIRRFYVSLWSPQVLISSLVSVIRLGVCFYHIDSIFDTSSSLCLMVCIDLFFLKKGSMVSTKMTAVWTWALFMSYGVFGLFQVYSISYFYSPKGVEYFSFVKFLTQIGLMIGSFFIFLVKFSKITHTYALRKVEKSYSKVAKVSGSKTTEIETVLFKKRQKIFDQSEGLFLEEEEVAPRNRRGDYELSLYPIDSSSVRCPNKTLNLRRNYIGMRGSFLEYFINSKRKWRHWVSSGDCQLSARVWLNNRRVENVLIVLTGFSTMLLVFDQKTRKILMKLKVEGLSSVGLDQRTEFLSLIGMRIRMQRKKLSFMMMTKMKSVIRLWTQSEARVYSLNSKIALNPRRVLRVTENQFRNLSNFVEFCPFDHLLAVKLFYVDKDDHMREVMNMAKFQTIAIFEVDEEYRRGKIVGDLSKIIEGNVLGLENRFILFPQQANLGGDHESVFAVDRLEEGPTKQVDSFNRCAENQESGEVVSRLF